MPLENKIDVINWESLIDLAGQPRDLTVKGSGEEHILEQSLAESAVMQNPRLIIFRKHDRRLRIVHSYKAPSASGRPSRRVESKVFDPMYMSFVPAYAAPTTHPVPFLLLFYDRLSAEENWYHFVSVEGVFAIQAAVTGSQVKFDKASISWQLARPLGGNLKGTGRVQIWHPNTQGNIPTSSVPSFSTTSRSRDRAEAELHEMPQSPAILIFTWHRGKFKYIHLECE